MTQRVPSETVFDPGRASALCAVTPAFTYGIDPRRNAPELNHAVRDREET